MANLRICACGNRYYGHSDRPLKGPVICSTCRMINRWRECAHCGVRFLASWRNDPKVYCSKACTGAAKKTRFERPCLECGTMYKPKRESARWCSKECAGIGRRKPEVPCAQCGELFWGKRGQIFCGYACMGKSRRGPDYKPKTSPADVPGTPIDDFMAEIEAVKAPVSDPEPSIEDQGAATPEQWRVLLWLARGDAMGAVKLRNNLGKSPRTVGELLAG